MSNVFLDDRGDEHGSSRPEPEFDWLMLWLAHALFLVFTAVSVAMVGVSIWTLLA
jgi:hypothetical protein